MAGGGVDRLSSLSNDLLRRILHFTPLKEAASTTALSRRWREPLWLSSAAINLETGVAEKKKHRQRQGHEHNNAHARFFSGSDDLVSAATGALNAADVPVTRLTLITWFPDYAEVASCYKDLVEVVLSHPAAHRVEELLLVAKDPYGNPYNRKVFNCTVTLDSLQMGTLRILELTNCSGVLVNHTEAVLPRLSSLRLSHCTQQLGSLQRVIDAAPSLTAVRLESVFITHEEAIEATWRHLRCPATTVLVLDTCEWEVTIGPHRHGWFFEKTVDRLKIDAMRLRRFSYKGPLRSYSFSPQPLEFEQVDLEFFEQGYYRVKDPKWDLETFWRFTRNFTSTKEMRLKVNHLEDITVLSEARQVELLPAFRRLQRLEFQGAHWTNDKTAAVTTILNLLHCCPVLTTAKYEEEDASNKQGAQKHKRTTRNEILMAAMVGPRYLFQCLQSSLRRVDLQFQLEKKDCLGVKLIKTFAENAMVLEEIRIDSGDEKLCEHMNPRIAKWNSSRKVFGATSFVVLPLKM
ncbi:hypothetical protein VPH35_134072 [Triticum aestivum]|uniref:uncharacterized protein n=1 Tax=Triticum aestivum TaxID=4565 RepID=UPI00162E948B|nr:uncharacterized protein LOC123168660 [Triticum aestivum]